MLPALMLLFPVLGCGTRLSALGVRATSTWVPLPGATCWAHVLGACLPDVEGTIPPPVPEPSNEPGFKGASRGARVRLGEPGELGEPEEPGDPG
ncbi:hypothetical protein NDU88_010455 [Pleurodeles waltl]|uniref:Uncharacterized protein n=1 Tax=Pleurodeles waltl TaxID=8319 RepID=A0AAV7R0A4_PLEWA|nr:hypothetical protein NDU88_010455 [Pleurodeles waltl]